MQNNAVAEVRTMFMTGNYDIFAVVSRRSHALNGKVGSERNRDITTVQQRDSFHKNIEEVG